MAINPFRRLPLFHVIISFTMLVFVGCQPSTRFAVRESEYFPRMLSSSTYPQLKSRIDAILADSLFPPANVGMEIVSLTTGESLYELNNRMLFNPASNQKLFTAAAALSILGFDYSLTTVVCIDTTTVPVVYVKGFGDPLMTTTDIDSMARAVASMLPDGKSWTLAGDVSYFDDLYWGHGWMWDDEPDPSAMFISSLSANGNTIAVRIGPGRNSGEPVSVSFDSSSSFVTFENTARTVADSVTKPLKVTRRWKERKNTIDIRGEVRLGDSVRKEELTVWQPELYFLSLFSGALQRQGVVIGRSLIDTVPPTATQIALYTNRLDSVITYMNKVSDNLSAENILKVISAQSRGIPGTSTGGIDAVRRFMAGRGIDTAQSVQVDGSGLSRYNLLSPDVLVKLLTSVYKDSAIFPVFYHSLPIAGRDGSLSSRMRGFATENNLRAKTGTFSGVSCLSGYVRTADGEMLAFSMMMQGIPGSVRPYRQVQDRLGIFLSLLTRANFE